MSSPPISSATSAQLDTDQPISAAKYKLMSPEKLPISRSPCITIPAGLSPSSFLESPVLLSNIKAEPSPTTGSFFKYHLMQSSSSEAAFSFATNNSISNTSNDQNFSSFGFQFHTAVGSASGLSSTGPSISAGLDQIQSEQIRQFQDQYHAHSVLSTSLIKSEVSPPKESASPARGSMHASELGSISATESEEISRRDQPANFFQEPHSDPRDTMPLVTADRSSNDGYNWRKYGQKLVKGSEFPRSYYKCTHPNCEVKKIFECSPDGHITEIVYKGSHDHPKPQPSRRFTPGALMSIHEEKTNDTSFAGQEDKFKPNGQTNNVDPNGMSGLSPQQTIDDSQDGANDEIDEDDQFSKRRKTDGSMDIAPMIKPIREPRVVVQTVSEVNILDDGYKWRKYGQKVVRGNPNPRSYYKCSNAGCSVRKLVERASHDPKAVITTYEGKHNHDVPTARSSSHELAGPRPGTGISRITSAENDSVGLNLGVGVRYGAESRANGQLNLMGSGISQSHNSIAGSGMMGVQPPQISGCYATANGDVTVYQTRDNHVDNRGLEMPRLHPGNECSQNIRRLLMGP
ncbi:DNA-binding transcription factor [Lithospermum erythrorhizon]|uniref:DNA-binding transcription factor n=1 Tax=Lithospermum erythrorhizon TaxID=34254 RepID=A0AAV3RNA3_LITER